MNNPIGRAWLKTSRKAADRMLDREMLDELERRLEECDDHPSFLDSMRQEQIQ